jgi:uncharacterized protein YqjF (DUF2071 family)
MILRFGLSLIFLIAGMAHLMTPHLFDPAIPFDQKLEINVAVGILEILLFMGLCFSRTKDVAARMSALWLLLLVPVHIYVSVLEIPIFGVSHPLVLWGRTIFQFTLFFWALSLQDTGWIISQRWSDVLFLHYEVDAKELQEKVPYPIDFFKGKAIVSIVPFAMGRIRFPFLPAIPGFSKLYELNLRTYVRINNRPAVYFFTLDSNHLPGVLVARLFFSLPYRWKKMQLNNQKNYHFKSPALELRARIDSTDSTTDFDLWCTERYALVTKFFGKDLWGVVEHEKWKLQKADLEDLRDDFSTEFINLKSLMGASYSSSLDVRFKPFRFLTLH